MAVVAVLLVVAVAVATVAIVARQQPGVTVMPSFDDGSADRWPLDLDDDAGVPYTRGSTSAARLTGRR